MHGSSSSGGEKSKEIRVLEIGSRHHQRSVLRLADESLQKLVELLVKLPCVVGATRLRGNEASTHEVEERLRYGLWHVPSLDIASEQADDALEQHVDVRRGRRFLLLQDLRRIEGAVRLGERLHVPIAFDGVAPVDDLRAMISRMHHYVRRDDGAVHDTLAVDEAQACERALEHPDDVAVVETVRVDTVHLCERPVSVEHRKHVHTTCLGATRTTEHERVEATRQVAIELLLLLLGGGELLQHAALVLDQIVIGSGLRDLEAHAFSPIGALVEIAQITLSETLADRVLAVLRLDDDGWRVDVRRRCFYLLVPVRAGTDLRFGVRLERSSLDEGFTCEVGFGSHRVLVWVDDRDELAVQVRQSLEPGFDRAGQDAEEILGCVSPADGRGYRMQICEPHVSPCNTDVVRLAPSVQGASGHSLSSIEVLAFLVR